MNEQDLIYDWNTIDYSIKSYAKKILKIILPNQKIKIYFDKSKPNGTPRKILDSSVAIKYGWKPKIGLDEGFDKVYEAFLRK